MLNEEATYKDILIDYYRNPRNYGRIENAKIISKDANPLCGDEVEIFINVDNEKISEAKFVGNGCIISIAATSLLLEKILNADLNHVLKLDKEFILQLLGIDLSPIRLKCALLPLKALKLGVCKFLSYGNFNLENQSKKLAKKLSNLS